MTGEQGLANCPARLPDKQCKDPGTLKAALRLHVVDYSQEFELSTYCTY